MKPCLRCGRWFEASRADPQRPTKPAAPMPLEFLNVMPVAVSAWIRVCNDNSDTTSNAVPPAAASTVVTPHSSTAAGATPRHEDLQSLRRVRTTRLARQREEAAAAAATASCPAAGPAAPARRLCGYPDCSWPPADDEQPAAAAPLQRGAQPPPPRAEPHSVDSAACRPDKWEFVAACGCCGRVWPVPVPHPTAALGAAAGFGFACCDYPAAWRQALVVAPSAAQAGRSAAKTGAASARGQAGDAGASSIKCEPCPSLDPRAAAAAPDIDVVARLELRACVAAGLGSGLLDEASAAAAAQHRNARPPHALLFPLCRARVGGDASAAPAPVAVGCAASAETLRDTTRRAKELAGATRANIDSAQQRPAPVLPTPSNNSCAVRAARLCHAMQTTSVIAARSCFVGASQAAGVAVDAAPAAVSDDGAPKRRALAAAVLPQRRARRDATDADHALLAPAPVLPPNGAVSVPPDAAGDDNAPRGSGGAESRDSWQTQKLSAEDLRAARAATRQVETIQWRTCGKCARWRVLGVDALPPPAPAAATNGGAGGDGDGDDFECALLGDGTTCESRDEGHLKNHAQLALKRRRSATLSARDTQLADVDVGLGLQ